MIFSSKSIYKCGKTWYFDCVINFIVWNGEQAGKNIEIFKDRTRQFIYISTVCVLNHEIECNVNEANETGNAYSGYGRGKGFGRTDLVIN